MNNWAAVPKDDRQRLRAYVFARDGGHCRVRMAGVCQHAPGCRGCAEEVDHIIPRHMGGAVLDPSNCRASCRPCNRGRRTRRGREPGRRW